MDKDFIKLALLFSCCFLTAEAKTPDGKVEMVNVKKTSSMIQDKNIAQAPASDAQPADNGDDDDDDDDDDEDDFDDDDDEGDDGDDD